MPKLNFKPLNPDGSGLCPYFCTEAKQHKPDNHFGPIKNGLNGGLFGELSEMVRLDMTIEEAIAFHVNNWGFKGGFADNPKTIHEISHQILMHACVYTPELQFLFPQTNSETGKMRPTGYNGFTNGESVTLKIQRILKILSNKEIGYKREISSLLDDTETSFSTPVINDVIHWNDVSTRDGRPLFNIKFSSHFKSHGSIFMPRDCIMKCPETHPDLIEDMQPLPFSSFEALIKKLEKIERAYFPDDTNFNEDKFLNLKVRDLHKTIGGEEAAAEFLQFAKNRAQAMGIKKAAEFTAAP